MVGLESVKVALELCDVLLFSVSTSCITVAPAEVIFVILAALPAADGTTVPEYPQFNVSATVPLFPEYTNRQTVEVCDNVQLPL